MSYSDNKKATIISLLSGKGGVGKTSICLSIGTILSHLNKKVLLIDFDIATHGMSYFFTELVSENYSGIIELIQNPKPFNDSSIINYKDMFDVLPSTTHFKSFDHSIINKNDEIIYNTLKNVFDDYSNKYDYILIDCPAGNTYLVDYAIKVSNKVIIVSEADPVSVWATKSIEYAYGNALPNETFGLINKLFIEEQSSYRTIVEYSKMTRYLPPIPFDMEVRRKFARKMIPADLKNPTEFIISICYALKDLIPSLEKDINIYLSNIRASKTDDIKNKLNDVEQNINKIRKAMIDNQYRRDYSVDKLIKIIILTIGFLAFLVSIISTKVIYFIDSDLLRRILIMMIPLVIISLTQLIYIWSKKKRREERIKKESEVKLQSELEILINKRNRLKVVLNEEETSFL